ncbi:MAG: FkbM family methyltransferase [Holosporaceae bacterium]
MSFLRSGRFSAEGVLILFCVLLLGVMCHWQIRKVKKQNRQALSYLSKTAVVNKKESPSDTLFRIAYEKFGIQPRGVIHLGAHKAEELAFYQSYGVKDILWIEANPELEPLIRKQVANHKGSQVQIFAASDVTGKHTFHVPIKHTHCASLLPLEKMLDKLPVRERKIITVAQKRLDDVVIGMKKAGIYNVMLLDIQGAELKALKGSVKTLKQIDALITEVTWCEAYKGGCQIQELDEFLRVHGFVRLATLIDTPRIDGDALYLKQHIIDRYDPLFKRKQKAVA